MRTLYSCCPSYIYLQGVIYFWRVSDISEPNVRDEAAFLSPLFPDHNAYGFVPFFATDKTISGA